MSALYDQFVPLTVLHQGDVVIIMSKPRRTMQQLSYGIARPLDLLAKLNWEAEKLTASPHPFDVFNFIVTAAVLAEWIQQFYDSAPAVFSAPTKEDRSWLLPDLTQQWIVDSTCLPNRHCDLRHHVGNALSICTFTANASKHFRWEDRGAVQTIGENPRITDFYQYFFTSTAPDLYVEYQGENYGLQQIKGILLQFYAGLIHYLEEKQGRCDAGGRPCNPVISAPTGSVLEDLKSEVGPESDGV